jgi:hypothetical protein
MIMNRICENQNLLYIVSLIRHTIVVCIRSIIRHTIVVCIRSINPMATGCFIILILLLI